MTRLVTYFIRGAGLGFRSASTSPNLPGPWGETLALISTVVNSQQVQPRLTCKSSRDMMNVSVNRCYISAKKFHREKGVHSVATSLFWRDRRENWDGVIDCQILGLRPWDAWASGFHNNDCCVARVTYLARLPANRARPNCVRTNYCKVMRMGFVGYSSIYLDRARVDPHMDFRRLSLPGDGT